MAIPGRVYEVGPDGVPVLTVDYFHPVDPAIIHAGCADDAVSPEYIKAYFDAGLMVADWVQNITLPEQFECMPVEFVEDGQWVRSWGGVNFFKRPMPWQWIGNDSVWVFEQRGDEWGWVATNRAPLQIGPSGDPDNWDGYLGADAGGSIGAGIDKNTVIAIGVSLALYFLFWDKK